MTVYYLLRTTCHLLLIADYSLLTTHYSLLTLPTSYFLLLITSYLLLTHYSLLISTYLQEAGDSVHREYVEGHHDGTGSHLLRMGLEETTELPGDE